MVFLGDREAERDCACLAEGREEVCFDAGAAVVWRARPMNVPSDMYPSQRRAAPMSRFEWLHSRRSERTKARRTCGEGWGSD